MEYRGLLILAVCVVWIFYASGWPCDADKDGFHSFGDGCSLRCYCLRNESCKEDGSCNGECALGRFGPGCQYVDIAHEDPEKANHSSNLHNSTHKYAYLAVDDDINTCSATNEYINENGHPWWRKSFGSSVTFTYIEFHVHADHFAFMSHYRVSVANVSDWNDINEWSNDTTCYETQGDDHPISRTSGALTVLGVFCKPPVVGNTIRIELRRSRTQLELCDVYISQECERGRWGINCTEYCSGCIDEHCNKTNGVCFSPGCKPGLKNTATCNQVCDKGRWGTNCSGQCNGCIDEKCNATDGVCRSSPCKLGYKHTLKCDKVCDKGKWGFNCFGHCNGCIDDKCNATNGVCHSSECKPGYMYTPNCDKVCDEGRWGPNCSYQCNGCFEELCYPASGMCNRGCKPGYINSLKCDAVCDKGRWGPNCKNHCNGCIDELCNTASGVCNSSGCKPGYINSAKCDAVCEKGRWGINCNGQCKECIDQVCNKTSGVCHSPGCKPGYTYTPKCEQACAHGRWGTNCTQNCIGCINEDCNKTSGVCLLLACKPGYKYTALCDQVCDKGRWGPNCKNHCNGCIDELCNTASGVCNSSGCKSGYINSAKCDAVCEKGRWGINCNGQCNGCIDQVCNNTSGVCHSSGCKPGYTYTPKCEQACDHGRWGTNCTQNCSECINEDCNKTSGVCLLSECKPGYKFTALCDQACDHGRWGTNCTQYCSGCINDDCNKTSGVCLLSECKPGYKFTALCDQECQEGTYGHDCNQTCGHCMNRAPCDRVSGQCESCLAGYTGNSCDTLVEESSQFPVKLVSGVSAGMLILLVALIMTVVLLIRKRKGKRTQEHSNVLSTVREPISSVHDEPQQLAAAKPNNVSEQNCSPPTSAESVTTMFIQEPVYSNMQDLPPVESSGTTIALSQLQGYVMSKSADEPFFDLEFKKIPYGLLHPATSATAPVNAGKNRYKDTCAYDHSRVVLSTVDGKECSDYINACFIEGFCKKRAYIASQGPTEAMMDDFWRMIWQYDVSTVVMVTNLVEMGKMKCLRYWPLEVGSQKDFQALTTNLIFMEEFTDYTVRRLKLSHQAKPSVSRVVTQFHYTAWPDKDVPASTSSLLHFWRRIRAHDPDKKQPWVVHCSAGVGRTGTFIAMDILIDEGQARQTVDIYACVTKLRQQRVNMVQTGSQYKYLHRLMMEYLTLRSQFVSNNEIANYQNTLLQVDQKLNKTGLFLQYETEASYHTLEFAGSSIKGDEGDPYSFGTMPENAKKNRFDAILPNNRYRAMLTVSVDGRNDYINAVFMPSYKVDNKYILTQKPLSDTVVDCWRLIEARDISLVVTFPDEGNEQNGRMFPTTGSLTVGPFNIMFITEHYEEDYFVSRVFKVQYMKKERRVTQLLYQKWPRRQMAPPNFGEFLMLMAAVEKRTKSSTALIQCLDGATRSGLLLVLLYATECMSKDGEVSMPMVIRHLRTRRPQLIPNFEQYRFCYSLLTQYVESNVTYANT